MCKERFQSSSPLTRRGTAIFRTCYFAVGFWCFFALLFSNGKAGGGGSTAQAVIETKKLELSYCE